MIDITGNKYGKLTVISFAYSKHGAYWNCLCDCGNTSVVSGSKLRNGRTKSCGCITKEINYKRRKDLTNQRFGRLVAKSYDKEKGKWFCQCDCGNTKYITAGALVDGRTKSCGCIHKEVTHNITFKDLTNNRYGKLLVKSFNGTHNGKSYWDCECDCGNLCVCSSDKLYGGKISCGCDSDTAHKGSVAELEIKELVETISDYKFIKNKTILDGLEIDLYSDELKLGIEYNGSVYHASLNGLYKDLPKNYHRDKFLLAKEKGIHLISIFDVDWENNRQKLSSFLSKLLVKNKSIYARSCNIHLVDNDIANDFIDKYHIQGSNPRVCKINYGLYYNNELYAVMSFGKLRLQSTDSGEYELHRYCVKDNYVIIGGANKLLKHFESDYSPNYILSYSDNDYFLGGIYERLGFINVGQSTQRYYWYYNNTEIRRERCKLRHLKSKFPTLYEEAISTNAKNKEDYIMCKLGARKVYRSGITKWEKFL